MIKGFITASIAAVVLVGLVGGAKAEDFGTQLSAAELKEFLTESTTTRHIHKFNIDNTTYWRADGTAAGTNSRGQSATGTWEVKENGEVCSKWTESRWNAVPCHALYKQGDTYKWVSNGDVWADNLKHVKGNPENL